ncbi:hypothetical protein IJ843_03450 [bacterium]|nr:hypothetical protein [bacterium]
MSEEKQTKKCPFCDGEINIEAKKCKHCGEWLSQENKNDNAYVKNKGYGIGCLVTLAIIIGSFIATLDSEPEFDANKPMQSCLQIGNYRGAKASSSKDDSVCKNNDIPEGCKIGFAPMVFTGGCLNGFKEGSTMSSKYIELLDSAIRMDENRLFFYGK